MKRTQLEAPAGTETETDRTKSAFNTCTTTARKGSALPAKRCRVCDGRASGFNYGGLCCDSCKMFFKRNIHRAKELRCRCFSTEKATAAAVASSSSSCVRPQVNHVHRNNRKRCPACRLSKCLHIGMTTTTTATTSGGDPSISEQTNSTSSTSISISIPLKWFRDYHLTRVEQHQIECLSACYRASFAESRPESCLPTFLAASSSSSSSSSSSDQQVVLSKEQVFNLHANYARPNVRFCKSIPAFRALTPADQLTLLRLHFLDLNFTRLSFQFGEQESGVRLMATETGDRTHLIGYDFLMDLPEVCAELEALVHFRRAFHRQLASDPVIRDLVIGRLLFTSYHDAYEEDHSTYSSGSGKVSRPEFVRYQERLYGHLLRRYLCHRHGDHRLAKVKYDQINATLGAFAPFRRLLARVVTEQLDHTLLSPVIREVFDL